MLFVLLAFVLQHKIQQHTESAAQGNDRQLNGGCERTRAGEVRGGERERRTVCERESLEGGRERLSLSLSVCVCVWKRWKRKSACGGREGGKEGGGVWEGKECVCVCWRRRRRRIIEKCENLGERCTRNDTVYAWW